MSLRKVHWVGAYHVEDPTSLTVDLDTVRQALRDWSSLKDLGNNKLTSLRIVQERIGELDSKESPMKKGMALRAVLGDALEALQPEAGPPQPEDKRWQAYLILSEQYLHGRSPEWVQNQIFVSKGTYFHEQKRALEALTEILIQWEEDVQSRLLSAHRPGRSMAIVQAPLLAPPLPDHARIGQEAPLEELKHALLQSGEGSIVALYGLPGVGKTCLATALAHDTQTRAYFCDGILWAGMGRHADEYACMDIWADALGITHGTLARYPDFRSRAALLQRAIGQRRMLLIIDDVWRAESGMAMKIGGSQCAHLFITRMPKTAVELAGQRVFRLEELDAQEGIRLLAQFAPTVVEAQNPQMRALVEAVGGLPLALVLMGRHIFKQSHASQSRRLAQALTSLQDVEERFNLTLPVPPLETNPDLLPGTPLSLQTTISLSETLLSLEERTALSSLALFPPKPNTFSEEAALSVSGASVQVLDRLVDAGLVECACPDRYSLHRTIADYALIQAKGESADERMISWAQALLKKTSDEDSIPDVERENLAAAMKLGLDAQ